MANLTTTIMQTIAGTAYLGDDGLRDYHRAQAVKAALRRKIPSERLSGVREALNQYRVTAWLNANGKIDLRYDGTTILGNL